MKSYRNVLIVLGCPPRKDGRPSDCMISRVRKAIQLYKKNNYSRVIFSGGPSRRIPEADIMRIMCLNHLPHNKVLVERHSCSTVQNAVFCWERLKDKEVKRVTVLTSAYHLRRARYIFKQLYSHIHVTLAFESAADTFDPVESIYFRLREIIALLGLKIFGIR